MRHIKSFNIMTSSRWFKQLSVLLTSAGNVSERLRGGVHALVHCSDGWNRTAQIVSLVELIMDPYYRTIHGFCSLVEKEWVEFGHRFADRSGLDQSSEGVAPIFLQVDCRNV